MGTIYVKYSYRQTYKNTSLLLTVNFLPKMYTNKFQAEVKGDFKSFV